MALVLLADHDNTPAGHVRRIIAANGFPMPGDAAKVA